MQQHNEGHMQALLSFSVPMVVISIFFLYWYLLDIEINKTISLPTGLESVGSHEEFSRNKKSSKETGNDGTEGLEEEATESEGATSAAKEMEETPRRFRITKLRTIILVFTSLALCLLAYLLLVVSEANVWLSLLGTAVVIIAGLWQQISEEIRRKRLDRIAAIVTLVFLAASFMSLATYASKSIQEGEVYEGKARIVGYSYENYDNDNQDITRTDLEVAWGGEWGCPTENGKQCQAFVQGAMCESEKDDNNSQEADGGERNLEDEQQNEDENEDEGKEENDGGNNNNVNEDNVDAADGDDALEKEEQEVEELEEEVDEEKQQEEDLEEDLEDEEEYAAELEEEVLSDYTYYWDDDLLEDAYWETQDWSSIWGEYACYDLFSYDLSGGTYNVDEKPGSDDWPFIYIYGNCKRCDAYIVDYFSMEHFQQIQKYKTQGQYYLIVSFLGLILTGIMYFKHSLDPIAEGELELLPHDGGGAMA